MCMRNTGSQYGFAIRDTFREMFPQRNIVQFFKNDRPCLTTFPTTEKRVENTTRSTVFLTNFEVSPTHAFLTWQIFANPCPGSQFFLRVRSHPISARKWNVASKHLKRFSEIPRLKLRAGEGFCKDLLCQKTWVGDGGELERALDDAIGTGSTVRSCCENGQPASKITTRHNVFTSVGWFF